MRRGSIPISPGVAIDDGAGGWIGAVTGALVLSNAAETNQINLSTSTLSGTWTISGTTLKGVGTNNTFVGVLAGNLTLSGTDNVSVGASTLFFTTSGSQNSAFGTSALGALNSGSDNVAMGYNAGVHVTTGTRSVAIGSFSRVGSAQEGNVSIGYFTGAALTTGTGQNTLVGYNAGSTLTTGNYNTHVGSSTVASGATVNHETVIGAEATGSGTNTVTLGRAADTAVVPANLQVGSSGVSGFIILGNGTSGLLTLLVGSGALGSKTLTIPSGALTGDTFAVLGLTQVFNAPQSIQSVSATAFAVGRNGTVTPALNVDCSTSSSETGLNIKSAAATAGLAVSVTSSNSNEALTIDAKGSGTITLGGTSTGNIAISRAITYGGVTLTNSVTGTGKMVLDTAPQISTIELGHATQNTLSASGGIMSIEGVAIPTISSTHTLTNKAITKRVVTTTDDATAVIDVTATDVYELSAVANATTFSTTGTPVDGQQIVIRWKDAGVAKGLTWDAIFVPIGVTLPTTTVAGKWGYVGVQYNSAASKFHVLAVGAEA